MQDVIGRLISLPNMTWYWIDWLIGIEVPYGDAETGDWDAGALWGCALAPWQGR